jgi:hypothetical protein
LDCVDLIQPQIYLREDGVALPLKYVDLQQLVRTSSIYDSASTQRLAGSANAVCKLTPATAPFRAANHADLHGCCVILHSAKVDLVMQLGMFTLSLR